MVCEFIILFNEPVKTQRRLEKASKLPIKSRETCLAKVVKANTNVNTNNVKKVGRNELITPNLKLLKVLKLYSSEVLLNLFYFIFIFF